MSDKLGQLKARCVILESKIGELIDWQRKAIKLAGEFLKEQEGSLIQELNAKIIEKDAKIAQLKQLAGNAELYKEQRDEARREAGDLRGKLNNLLSQKPAAKKPEKREVKKAEVPRSDAIVIRFDGGQPNNTPPYGQAYGSYKIGDGGIVRLNFGAMSNNAAEMKTLIAALKDVQQTTNGNYRVHIIGDSQIVINWVNSIFNKGKRKISNGASTCFINSVDELRQALNTNYRLIGVVAEWRPREELVAVFGH